MDRERAHQQTHQQTDSQADGQGADARKRIAVLAVKIERKLASLPSNANVAKSACVLLKELRTYIHVSSDNQAFILQSGLIDKMLCLLPRCVEFRVMISDLMRCIIPFARAPAFKFDCCELICRCESIKTLLVLLRRHPEDEGICIQCVELVYAIIDHHCRNGRDTGTLINFIVMHGGISVLPQQLIRFDMQKQDIALRRVVSCKLSY